MINRIQQNQVCVIENVLQKLYNIVNLNQMKRDLTQKYLYRSSLSSNNQPYKIPNSVRSTFLNRDYFTGQPDDLNINKMIRRSMFMTVTCTLCEKTFQREQMIALSDCNHIFCTQCMHQYIIYKLNVMEEVACPQQNCDKLLDTNSICYTSLPQEYKNKYKKLQVWKQTVNNPNLKLCPEQKCNGVIDILNEIYTCQQCKIVYCPQCMLKKHEGPCDKNFQQNFLDWKRCPACNMFIERNEGCNHMTCRCSHQFCYVCLANWEQKHYECGQIQNQARQWVLDEAVIVQMSTGKRMLLVILMIILFPLFLALGIVVLAIFEAGALILGLLCGGCALGSSFFRQSCCCCLGVVILFPFATVIAMIFAVGRVFIQAIPIGITILKAYFRNMCNIFPFGGHQQNPQMDEIDF